MLEQGNALSRNPNICASCSSITDGMEDSATRETASLASGEGLISASTETLARDQREEEAEPTTHHFAI